MQTIEVNKVPDMCFYRIVIFSVILLLSACESVQSLLPVQQLVLHKPCDITHQPCVVSGDNVSLEIEFSKKIQALMPFQINLDMTSGSPDEVKDIAVAFSMESMQMGIHRYRFLPTVPGSWSANVTLPVCVTGRSDWIMDVEIKTESTRQLFEVMFVLDRG